MAYRLVQSSGHVADPVVVNVYASGTIQRNTVVDFDRVNGRVAPASSSSTFTTIFGVSLDYIQGASDSFVKVIPFQPGQMWEADCALALTTAVIGQKLAISASDAKVLNNIGTGAQNSASAIFFAVNVDGPTTGSGKVLGEFLRLNVLQSSGVTVV